MTNLYFKMTSWRDIADMNHFHVFVLFLVIYAYYVEKTCCETLIAGQYSTLSCSFPSSTAVVNWKDTDKFSSILSRCEAIRQKCDDNTQYRKEDLHFSAQRINATSSLLTFTSTIPGNYTLICKQDYGNAVLQTFNLTFVDADKIKCPRCEVLLLDGDISKVKLHCEVDSTPGIEVNLKILGAGENIQESPDRVYYNVDYDHFVDVSNVTCIIDIPNISRSCNFPRGVLINKQIEGNDTLFFFKPTFENQ